MQLLPTESILCPYCHQQMRKTSAKWLMRETFVCDSCGDFPDYLSLQNSHALFQHLAAHESEFALQGSGR